MQTIAVADFLGSDNIVVRGTQLGAMTLIWLGRGLIPRNRVITHNHILDSHIGIS